MVSILQIFASTKKLINVPKRMLVLLHTIKLKDYIISRSTKLSSAQSSPNICTTANTVTIVHLPTQQETSRQESSISCKRMPTFTCSISRLSGVHSTKNTTKLSATMLITGKILGENPASSITTLPSFVQTGKQGHLSVSTKKAVLCKQLV